MKIFRKTAAELSDRAEALETENETFATENAALKERVTGLEHDLSALRAEKTETEDLLRASKAEAASEGKRADAAESDLAEYKAGEEDRLAAAAAKAIADIGEQERVPFTEPDDSPGSPADAAARLAKLEGREKNEFYAKNRKLIHKALAGA
jgi:chromosome segregation ATPase